jgi:hypothetical protein
VAHEPEFDMKDIVNQLKTIMESYWKPEDEGLRTCKKCGTAMTASAAAK